MTALTIRLPHDLYERLVIVADEEERTVAGVLRLAARRYLDATLPPTEAEGS